MGASAEQRALNYVRVLKGWALKKNVIDHYGLPAFNELIAQGYIEMNKHGRAKITDLGLENLTTEEVWK